MKTTTNFQSLCMSYAVFLQACIEYYAKNRKEAYELAEFEWADKYFAEMMKYMGYLNTVQAIILRRNFS